jgi:hypothetical protein
MEDPELAAIRAARMGQGAQGGGGQPSGDDQAKREAEEQMRRDLLATVLDPAARERRESPFCTSLRYTGTEMIAFPSHSRADCAGKPREGTTDRGHPTSHGAGRPTEGARV